MTEKKHKKNTGFKFNMTQYGSIVFGVGLLIVLVAAFIDMSQTTTKVVVGTLTLLGIAIGLLNVTNNEAISFLVASLALVMLLGPFFGAINQTMLQTAVWSKLYTYVIALIVPAAVVVAIKTFFLTAKDE